MWYVLYTKPRNEKKTAKLLEDRDIEVYCPVQETMRQWSDRKKKVVAPVFTSYIFVSLKDYDLQKEEVLSCPGAVKFLWWNNKPGIVRDVEIQAIKEFLTRYKGAVAVVDLQKGNSVVVTEGPLKEQQGKVIKIKGNKAILELPTLGCNIVAEIPVQSLQIKH